MRKILFSILIIFSSCQIFAQKKITEKKITAATINEPSNTSFNSERAIKFNVFSPLLGYSQFSFEKSIVNRRSLEFVLGIIGAGRNLNIQPLAIPFGLDRLSPYKYRSGHKNQFGGFFELGYKFIKPIKTYKLFKSNSKVMHALKGSYVKPSFIFGAYSFNQFRNDSSLVKVRRQHRFGALMVNLGHQFEFKSSVVLELYMGVGGEVDNVKDEDDLYGHPFVLAIAKDNPSVNFAFTAGFRLGFLLK